MSKINNTQIDNAKDVDVVILMCNLIEYNDNYSTISGGSWQYFEPANGKKILNHSNPRLK